MIKVIKYTSYPLSLMGEVASFCWNSVPSKKIALDCLDSNHGRVFEYVDIIIAVEKYSARMIRELYTHTIGITKLQASTRYVNYDNMEYYTPPSLKDNDKYTDLMYTINEAYTSFMDNNIPKEDIANILPLGMNTKVVLKINLRAILNMFEVRTCTRTYVEFREFMKELKETLLNLDPDWKQIIEKYAVTKCDKLGYCNEKVSCGRYDTIN